MYTVVSKLILVVLQLIMTILHQAAEASCSAAFHQGQVTNI